jgi:hypothetical protein
MSIKYQLNSILLQDLFKALDEEVFGVSLGYFLNIGEVFKLPEFIAYCSRNKMLLLHNEGGSCGCDRLSWFLYG